MRGPLGIQPERALFAFEEAMIAEQVHQQTGASQEVFGWQLARWPDGRMRWSGGPPNA